METGLTKQRVIAELTRSPHGDLKSYMPLVTKAAKEDAELTAHLVAHNAKNGQIKDSKIALPVGSMVPGFPFNENSWAHLAQLDPRELVRAIHFMKDLNDIAMGKAKFIPGIVAADTRRGSYLQFRKFAQRYLAFREKRRGMWDKAVIQHRESMRTLYGMFRVKPAAFADRILFKGQLPAGSVHEAVAKLPKMSGRDAAIAISKFKLPSLVVTSCLGDKKKDIDFVMALIDSMTATELVTNTKLLQKLGIKDVPELRAAYEAGLRKVAESKKAVFKTTRAAEAIKESYRKEGDQKLAEKLVQAQEKQLQLGGVEGNWLVLGDKSGSMASAIEAARQVAGLLAKRVKGEVYLVFFDNSPRAIDVSGKTYEEIKALTRHVQANGGTSIGCGLQWALDRKLDLNGIAICSDGGENATPMFTDVYRRYMQFLDREIPVYLYLVNGQDTDRFSYNMKSANYDLQLFDLRGGFDYYSLEQITNTLRASRYSLLDEIMETPLLSLDEVFNDAQDEPELV